MPKITAHRIIVRMADNEWGNELMREAAEEAAKLYDGVEHLFIDVYEHAGWSLLYYRDGGKLPIVGSANDMAVYQGRAAEIQRMFRADTHWVYLPGIRRTTLHGMVAD